MGTSKKTKAPPVTPPAANIETSSPATLPTGQPVVKAVKAPPIVQNGVTRPSSGLTKKVWDIADELSGIKKAPATRAEVTEKGLAEGLVVGTIHTQYGKWRKFHGLSKTVEKSAPVQPAGSSEAAASAAVLNAADQQVSTAQ